MYLLKTEADTVHCLFEGVKDDKLVEAVWCFPPKQEGTTAVRRARATGAKLYAWNQSPPAYPSQDASLKYSTRIYHFPP